jgi:hypothetical protein
MMICEHIEKCPILKRMSNSAPFAANVLKIRYCHFNKFKCIRYKLLNIIAIDDVSNYLEPPDEMSGLELLEMKLNESRQKLYGYSR